MEFFIFIIILICLFTILANFFPLEPVNKDVEHHANQISKIAASSKLPEEVLDKLFKRVRKSFASGDFAERMTTNLILKKDEYLIYDIPEVSFCEERTVRIKGTSKSVRVRVMKGFSVGLGGFDATSEKQIVVVDTGNMTVTNKRIHFAGTSTTFDYPLSKINTIEGSDSTVAISRSGKTKIEFYTDIDKINLEVNVTPDEEDDDFEPQQVQYILGGKECKDILLEAISISQ